MPRRAATAQPFPPVPPKRSKAPKERSKAPSFAAFFQQVTGLRLTHGQAALAGVAFDGKQIGELPQAQQALASEMLGAHVEIPDRARKQILLLKGARGGGTLLACVRLVQLALSVDLSKLAPGQRAHIPIVSVDMRTGREALAYVAGCFAHPRLKRSVVKQTRDALTVRRNGREVVFECLPASGAGKLTRGRVFAATLIDEACFVGAGSESAVDVADIVRAIRARLTLPGSQLIAVSTAWAREGWMYEKHSANFGQPKDAIALTAPTLLLRDDDPELRQVVEDEQESDPVNAAIEFGASWLDQGAGLIFDEQMIAQCVDERRGVTLPPESSATAWAALDLAFSGDSSALCIVRRYLGDLELADLHTWKPKRGAPLKPSVVIEQALDRCEDHGVRQVYADIHHYEQLVEHAARRRIRVLKCPAGIEGKRQTYAAAADLMREGSITLPRHPRLLRAMRSVTAAPRPGGGFAIRARRRRGDHADELSAFVLAAWAAAGRTAKRSRGGYVGPTTAVHRMLGAPALPGRRFSHDGGRATVIESEPPSQAPIGSSLDGAFEVGQDGRAYPAKRRAGSIWSRGF